MRGVMSLVEGLLSFEQSRESLADFFHKKIGNLGFICKKNPCSRRLMLWGANQSLYELVRILGAHTHMHESSQYTHGVLL